VPAPPPRMTAVWGRGKWGGGGGLDVMRKERGRREGEKVGENIPRTVLLEPGTVLSGEDVLAGATDAVTGAFLVDL